MPQLIVEELTQLRDVVQARGATFGCYITPLNREITEKYGHAGWPSILDFASRVERGAS